MKFITERFWCLVLGIMVIFIGIISPTIVKHSLKRAFGV